MDKNSNLIPQQKRAACSESSRLLIRSVAGSGKTTTLVARIHHLLSLGFSPDDMIILTFTNKMANELMKKLPQLRWVGNFHGIGLRLINESLMKSGASPLMAINDMENKDIQKDIKNIICWKCSDVMVDRHLTKYYSGELSTDRKWTIFIKEYERYFKQNSIISFEQIEYRLLKMLRNGEIKKSFRHVMVDEFQDTSAMEMEIIEAFNSPNLYVTGDVAQNIYEWRGTTIDNILKFQADEVIEVYRTFRVPESQIRLVNHVLSSNNFGIDIKVESSVPGPAPIILEIDKENMGIELNMAIRKILSIYQPKDVMILCRTNRQINDINNLLQEDVPVDSVQSAFGWSSNIGSKILSFLRFCVDKSNYTVERLIKSIRLDTKDVIVKWINEAVITGKSLLDIISSDDATGGNALLDEVINISNKPIGITDKALLYYSAFVKPELANDVYNDAIAENCISTIKFFEDNVSHSIGELLSWLITLNTQDMIGGDNKIKVMTYHTAKGLESEVVILPWIEDGIFPKNPDTDDLWAELRLFYVGITRTKSLLYIIKTGDSCFLRGYDGKKA